VSGLAIAGTRVEINLIALVTEGRTRKQVIATERASRRLFHESQAVRAGNLLFLSGLLAADENGLVEPARVNPHYPYGICSASAQMEGVMRQAEAICEAARADLCNGVRLLTTHTDLREWTMAAALRRRFFPDGQPATTSVQVPCPLQVPGCGILADLWVGIEGG
jgi:enamine deaminase RidA (YjgF/YER057c/UK114 family)